MATPEELLDEVSDRTSFIQFVKVLADERSRAAELEKENPTRYMLGGALNWQNADIASFLYGGLDSLRDKPLRRAPTEPTWRAFAEFLYHGKIIE